MIRQVFTGIATLIPGVYRIFSKGTGGTDSARYCYSVWLRHLVIAHKNGFSTQPKVIAELGPGDSLGIGLAALISGVETYYAFDVYEFTNENKNIEIFDELVSLFKNREDIPGGDLYKPHIDSYEFPGDILSDEHINTALEESRIKLIRNSITNINNKDSIIKYAAPWFGTDLVKKKSVDMIYSQAVLEHVDDLSATYKAMHSWLKPTGFISHQIDFRSHGTSDKWNGHWRYSDFMWKLIRGKRPYLLNRVPHSTHIKLLNETNFEISCDLKIKTSSEIDRKELAPRFKNMSEDDLTTSGAFIQARIQSGRR